MSHTHTHKHVGEDAKSDPCRVEHSDLYHAVNTMCSTTIREDEEGDSHREGGEGQVFPTPYIVCWYLVTDVKGEYWTVWILS